MMLSVTRYVPALGALAFCLQPSFAGDLVHRGGLDAAGGSGEPLVWRAADSAM